MSSLKENTGLQTVKGKIFFLKIILCNPNNNNNNNNFLGDVN